MQGGITPWTALYAANLFEGEKKMTGQIVDGRDETFGVDTVEKSLGYVPLGPDAAEPRDPVLKGAPCATVDYLPEGSRSDIFDGIVGKPMLEIIQTVPLSSSGLAKPFASIVGNLVHAVAKMRPTMFPINMRVG